MGLYKLFSCNVEIQYKSCLLSKAMLFTLITTMLNIVLPFIVAYKSKGFWLRSHTFYEQPLVRFTYEYLVVAETDDPSQPIVCGEAALLNEDALNGEENCAQLQVQEFDYNYDGKHEALNFKLNLNVPKHRTITSVLIILGLEFKLKSVCPLQMQSLAVIDNAFPVAPSGLKFYGDIELYQVSHLPCEPNIIHTKYNSSLFNHKNNNNDNVVDLILENYFSREVTTQVKTLHSRSQNGHTSSMEINIYLRVPEMLIRYLPSILQELKWAWPQYLSLVVVFYWIFNRIKKFVFNNRLLMAWEVVPWKKH
ncbi:transmembrane protein 231 [Ostrinia furnacalis]|uniref:transmembrane protein 231 n=1 Tax=Ostrinia furnacalis TaxID=93504 RepID=UPI00103EC3E1|nr:transmembrane protein 231 [Ostrinia furnacalis]